jgi:hypothetical protein
VSYTDFLKSHPIKLKHAPRSFDAPFSTFYTEYLEPNLPSPPRVQQFNDLLKRYCAMTEATLIIRNVGNLTRGETYQTDSGDKFLPSDNAPGWWLHALLMSDVALPDDLTELVKEMPKQVFQAWKLKTLNGYGFHLAHIDDVKNRDTNWQLWDRSELIKRFTLSIHPCNWFLLSKTDWQKWGSNRAIISYIRNKYLRRYGTLIGSISDDYQLEIAGLDTEKPELDIRYFYGRYAESNAIIPHRSDFSDNSDKTVVRRRPHVRKEWLGQGITLDLRIKRSRFVLSHDMLCDWVRENTNALNTKSWKIDGHYHWPCPSAKMLAFLKAYQR